MKFLRAKLDPNTIVLLKHIGIGLLVLSVAALIVTGVWYGTRIESLNIKSIEIVGGETINHEEVKIKAEQVLEGQYIGLVPRHFAWFFPQEEMLAALTPIERIHNIAINRTSGTDLRITFDEYTPQALWCKSLEQSECVFLDVNGYAFGHSPSLTGGTFLRFIKTGSEPTLGTAITNAETLANVKVFVSKLEEHGWYISHVEIDQVNDVFLKVVGGGELKVKVSDNPQHTIDNLLVILGSEEFVHLKPGNFQYIDLRFENKIYVNEEKNLLTGDTASGTAAFAATSATSATSSASTTEIQ